MLVPYNDIDVIFCSYTSYIKEIMIIWTAIKIFLFRFFFLFYITSS